MAKFVLLAMGAAFWVAYFFLALTYPWKTYGTGLFGFVCFIAALALFLRHWCE